MGTTKTAEAKIGELTKAIRNWFDRNGKDKCAVLGISGGKDSTVAAALLARALGPERVVGVMMPCGVQKDIADSEEVVKVLGIRSATINIGKAFSDLQNEYNGVPGVFVTKDAQVNLQPRLRMAALYMVAQSLSEGGFVINTCNRSEDYVGYATKFGDCAGDVSVLGNLLVSEILEIGDAMDEIPKHLVHKAPSDGLWGDTDEDRLGFTYDQLEKFILKGTSGDRKVDAKIVRMNRNSRHKYEEMPVLSKRKED